MSNQPQTDRSHEKPQAQQVQEVVNTPRSQQGYRSISSDTDSEKETADAEFAAGGLKTRLKKSKEQAKQQLQAQVDEAARRYRAVWKQDTSSEKAKVATELVLIRAMKSHHPAPVVGSFSFQDIYTNFVDGMKYTVPRYVGQHLEETENAIIL